MDNWSAQGIEKIITHWIEDNIKIGSYFIMPFLFLLCKYSTHPNTRTHTTQVPNRQSYNQGSISGCFFKEEDASPLINPWIVHFMPLYACVVITYRIAQ